MALGWLDLATPSHPQQPVRGKIWVGMIGSNHRQPKKQLFLCLALKGAVRLGHTVARCGCLAEAEGVQVQLRGVANPPIAARPP